jgi:transposase-like protein
MAKLPQPCITTKEHIEETDLPEHVLVALREIASSARDGLLALSVGVGMQVVSEIFEEEVTSVVGENGRHDPERVANRHGHEPRQVVLGGRLVKVDRPRVRSTEGAEVSLRTYRIFANRDLLTEAALGRMLAGLSSRRYREGLEPVGEVGDGGTSRSAISRRFVKGTEAALAQLFGRDLSGIDLIACFVDGMNVGEHLIVVALGIDPAGRKHPLGLWEGTTENKATCNALLSNLVERGLSTEHAMLFVIDGGKAIRAAIVNHFGELALIQRCTKHKERNVTDHLPKQERLLIARRLRKAWRCPDAREAERELRSIARSASVRHPGASASILEGLEETLTVTRLGITGSLARSLKTTNPIESMISIARTTSRNVKRWRSGKMALRWTAAGMLEAERQFRRMNGFRELQQLKAALRHHEEVVKGGKLVA